MNTLLQRNSFLRGVLVLLLCVVGLGNAWGQKSATFDASAQGYENAQAIENVTIADGITATFNKGTNSNAPKYYNAGTAIRVYGGGYFTITSTIGKITKVVLTFGSGDGSNEITTDTKTFSGGATWKGESESVTFYIGGSSGHRRIKTIAVTYTANQNAPTLTSISISGTPTTTEYYVGDTPNADGLSVNATYSDESTSEVTPTWTFSPETIEEGTTQVTATATYGGLEDSFSFDVKVNIAYFYTLDLTTKTYYEAETSHVYWDANVVHLASYKSSGSTNANNYLGGDDNDRTSSRFYTDNTITITPKTTITKIIFSATSSNYAQALSNSTYTNATATKDGNDIIIIPNASDQPINITVAGACGCTEVKVFYEPLATTISNAGYATLCLPYSAIVPDGLTAYTATDAGEYIKLSAMESGKIAANEGVVLKGEPGEYTFVATSEAVTATEGNQMVGVTEETALSATDNAYMLTSDNDHENVAFRLLATDYTLAANKAYLKVSDTEARTLISVMWDDNATGIENTIGESHVQNGAIFNLAGQKLTKAQKGINIINGKLVIK